MKNEGLIRHRQMKVTKEKAAGDKAVAQIGILVFLVTIQIFAGALWVLFFFGGRWFNNFPNTPAWWELSAFSAVTVFIRVWSQAFLRRESPRP